MERKNMVLLTVIAVATLLVAVVGATFAYFTATAAPSGSAEATVTTNKLDGANVKFESDTKKLEMLNYPGGLAVYGAKATIEKQQEQDQNDYEATFSLKIDYSNPTGTDLDWTLYMVESQYDNLSASQITTCKLHQKPNVENGNELQLWYSDQSDEEADPTSDVGCSGSAIETELQRLSATKIASGKLKANQESGSITKGDQDTGEYVAGDGQTDLSDRKINTKNKQNKYYYLVVKYPNENKNQSKTDAGQTISVSLSINGDIQLSLYTAPGA